MRGIVARAERCSGCRACMVACVVRHEGRFGTATARIRVAKEDATGADRPLVCRLCGKASCVRACRRGALVRHGAVGVVRLDEAACDGCGECVAACPFGAAAVHPETRLPLICDLCGGDPACVGRCATGAISYSGESQPQRREDT